MGARSFQHCPRCRTFGPPQTFCPRCSGPLATVPLEFLVGRNVGPYQVEGLLGVGAVGAVYRVRASLDAPPLALKLMFLDAEDECAEQRFLGEARLLRELRHEHIVRAQEVATSEWGPPYYTMECLDGRNLRQILRERPRGLPRAEALEHARQLAAGLQFAHDAGVVHRDVKPENVLVVPAGPSFTDKLLDFGFARWLVGKRRLRLTAPGDVVGTPAYLTPEQAGGTDPGPYTDQYALALVVAELLTGRKMRQGLEPFEIVTRELRAPLPAERLAGAELPAHVVAALQRATAPDPHDRFPDVLAFAAALEGRRSGFLRRRPGRRRLAWTVAALLGLAVAGAVAWLLLNAG